MNTQSEAKRFFATKVIDRARTEGVALSDTERRMLYWSESDPEFKADPKLVEQLASEISDEDYEAKIAALLQNAFAADSAIDSRAPEVWQQARSVLKQGDHYILIMISGRSEAQALVGILEVVSALRRFTVRYGRQETSMLDD